MSSSMYDPRKIEFVARMGRIPRTEDSRKIKELIPVMFRIPDPPKQEIVSVPLGRSMHAGPFDENKTPNIDDFITDLPPKECGESQLTPEEQQLKQKYLEQMIAARKEYAREREMQHTAQHLVNQALLQKELKEMAKREELLKDIKEKMTEFRGQENIKNISIFQEPQPQLDETLMKYITKELERLVPIRK